MTLKVFHYPPSRSVRVVWALEELGLDYEALPTKLNYKYLRSPEWRAINPLGKIPAFYDADERMIESVAIIHYLAEKHAGGKLARRPLDSDYGQFLQWLNFGEAGMGGYVSSLIGHTIVLPPERRIDAVRAWAVSECRNACDFIEEGLKDRDFLLGEEFSLADISVGYALFAITLTGAQDEIFSARTKLYLDRLTAREAFKKALETPG